MIEACDGCGAPIGDAWTALEVRSHDPIVACGVCAPILAALDRLVLTEQLDPAEAEARFVRERWGATNGPHVLHRDGRRPADVPDLRDGDPFVRTPAEAACES